MMYHHSTISFFACTRHFSVEMIFTSIHRNYFWLDQIKVGNYLPRQRHQDSGNTPQLDCIMTSWHGQTFLITGPLCRESTDYCELTHWGRVTHICISKLIILVQIMACCLDDTKSLSEPMLEYCWLDPQEQTSMKFYRNWYIFIQENPFWNIVWKMAAILCRPQCVNVIFMVYACSDLVPVLNS